MKQMSDETNSEGFTPHNTVDYLTTTTDIQLYIAEWGSRVDDCLPLLQLLLENSVEAVKRMRKEEKGE